MATICQVKWVDAASRRLRLLKSIQTHLFSAKVQKRVVGKLQVTVSESKAELWDSITYFATTTQKSFEVCLKSYFKCKQNLPMGYCFSWANLNRSYHPISR